MTPATLVSRLVEAINADENIVVERSKINEAKGVTTEYMAFLGLRKQDLRALKSKGLALDGLFKIPVGKINKGSRSEKRWIIIGADNEPRETEDTSKVSNTSEGQVVESYPGQAQEESRDI